jgi:hypothetical protein
VDTGVYKTKTNLINEVVKLECENNQLFNDAKHIAAIKLQPSAIPGI